MAIQILQDTTILCFHHSNMTENDDLFVNAMNHLKALKTKELLIQRRAAKVSGGENVDETTTALSSSSPTKEMEDSLSSADNTYMRQEDKGLLKACKEQIKKFLKEMSNKDDEYIAAEACRYFFQSSCTKKSIDCLALIVEQIPPDH